MCSALLSICQILILNSDEQIQHIISILYLRLNCKNNLLIFPNLLNHLFYFLIHCKSFFIFLNWLAESKKKKKKLDVRNFSGSFWNILLRRTLKHFRRHVFAGFLRRHFHWTAKASRSWKPKKGKHRVKELNLKLLYAAF